VHDEKHEYLGRSVLLSEVCDKVERIQRQWAGPVTGA
jgi:hypothetical protein